MTADLAQVGATCPGWRAWRTRGGLAARKGGTPPGVQARGATLCELLAAIAAAEVSSEPGGPAPGPNYRAILTALDGAAGPLTSRAVSDASGLALSTTVHSLGVLCAWGVTERHRDGRTWLYRRCDVLADEIKTAAVAWDGPAEQTA